MKNILLSLLLLSSSAFVYGAAEIPEGPTDHLFFEDTPITPMTDEVGTIKTLPNHEPLTLDQFKTIVEYHNYNYDYRLKYEACNNSYELKVKVRDWLDDEQNRYFVLKDDESRHLSLIFGCYDDKNCPLLVFTDSTGKNGKYMEWYINALKGLDLKNTKIVCFSSRRQNDSFSCGLFVLNDLRFFSKLYQIEKKLLMEILKFEESDNPSQLLVSKHPYEMDAYTQSTRQIRKKYFNPDHAEIFEQVTANVRTLQIDSQSQPKELNLAIEQQWRQIEFILQNQFSKHRITPFATPDDENLADGFQPIADEG